MNRSVHLRQLACACSLLFSLAACGGGGDGADESTTNVDSGTDAPAPAAPQPGPALGEARSGEATFYDATGAGNCSFDPSPGDLRVVALNPADYAGSAACGGFMSVRGPRGSVTVRVVDQCPGCQAGHLDLSREAFAQIADPASGKVPVSWQFVAGQLNGPVQYRYKEGSSRWWTAIQVRNHRLPIAKLEIRPSGSSGWITVRREPYNYFVHPGTIAPGALQVRITAPSGAALVDTLPEPEGGRLVSGARQFP
ncbi:expansin EXLX1 family cellulose-binding protein [Aquabacterium sp. A7-Y]|uniref:expansin EXLX1 family cellulose-binding protein n=1 Tax=Aquabacterium sp. A7-Y TaxID=1349605 RepID=UPI00223D09E1|nr:expansin EXLX1 family cellulose-binding protein [Aquabacterium sp. A7-Y]MCW7539509.1 expansin EXLX1 family cellulose-binding protein [Aquabacterium sp. A7-Y]